MLLKCLLKTLWKGLIYDLNMNDKYLYNGYGVNVYLGEL